MGDKEIEKLMSEIGSKSGYFKILYYLYNNKPEQITSLIGEIGIGSITVYRSMELLEKHRLVKIKADPTKSRNIRKVCSLTSKGKIVTEMMIQSYLMILDRDFPEKSKTDTTVVELQKKIGKIREMTMEIIEKIDE